MQGLLVRQHRQEELLTSLQERAIARIREAGEKVREETEGSARLLRETINGLLREALESEG